MHVERHMMISNNSYVLHCAYVLAMDGAWIFLLLIKDGTCINTLRNKKLIISTFMASVKHTHPARYKDCMLNNKKPELGGILLPINRAAVQDTISSNHLILVRTHRQ